LRRLAITLSLEEWLTTVLLFDWVIDHFKKVVSQNPFNYFEIGQLSLHNKKDLITLFYLYILILILFSKAYVA
jgi:hypothetical protein